MLTQKTVQLKKSQNAYERPQPHACFILSVDDDLVNEGGIMDLWVREARIFKYGSGVGTNFSNIRGEGEKLSGGGTSSGLMSFLKIGDRAAGAIKSGGTTRRAAKMVCLDLDHPEIEKFVNWKVEEEEKVAALIAAGYASDYEGEAYRTVSGQNSNNSVRIPNEFFKVLDADGDWELKGRSDGRVMKTVKARKLWKDITYAAWKCADPGTQYDTTINEWHTCPEGGAIRASNPCSEYMFLDNTACNLASVNLRRFFQESDNSFDIKGFEYTCRLWTVVSGSFSIDGSISFTRSCTAFL
jgi:ribonucleoside-diphosphate reductase alpha chain